MTKLFRLLAFSSILLLFSCGSDDEMLGGSADLLVGSWSVVASTCDDGVTTTTDSQGDALTSTYTFEGKDFVSDVVYRADGTYTSTTAYTQVITTTSLGQTFTQEVPVPETVVTGNWEIEGDKIFANVDSGPTEEAIILTLDENTFMTESVLETTTTQESFGEIFTITQKATIIGTLSLIHI